MSTSASVHVFSTERFSEAQLERLRAISSRLVIEQHSVTSPVELVGLLPAETEIMTSQFAPPSLQEVPRLRWFQSRMAGVNRLIGTELWKSNVPITTASGVHSTSIGEYVIGMMIALARRFSAMFAHQTRASWPAERLSLFAGVEMRGRTVLIIGYGAIGREVARLCSAFGMRVLAVKRDPLHRRAEGFTLPGRGDPDGLIPEEILPPELLCEGLLHAHFVVVAAAFTGRTHHLIGASELALMKPEAFLINVSRGDVIDEHDLIQALQNRQIAGAALDVFSQEPLPPESPLWGLERCLLTPHVAGHSPEYNNNLAELFAENLRRYLDGQPLVNQVNRDLGY